jgi:hypothetical protein
VKQQATSRSYAKWLHDNKVDAWEKDSKLLKPTYERILLQKIWASLAGIQLEPKRGGGPRVIEKKIAVVSLPDGNKFQVDSSDEAEPVMQLFSAYVDALTREPFEMDIDDAMERTKKLLDSGKLAKMLEVEE